MSGLFPFQAGVVHLVNLLQPAENTPEAQHAFNIACGQFRAQWETTVKVPHLIETVGGAVYAERQPAWRRMYELGDFTECTMASPDSLAALSVQADNWRTAATQLAQPLGLQAEVRTHVFYSLGQNPPLTDEEVTRLWLEVIPLSTPRCLIIPAEIMRKSVSHTN